MTHKSIILIPTLKEKENLKDLLPKIFNLMPGISVLVVDDNSNDGTQELVENLAKTFGNLFFLSRTADFGYGKSSIDGFKWILKKPYEYLVTMDADFSHDPSIIPTLLDKLTRFDVVVGSRYTKDGGVKNWNLFRQALSKFANLYVRVILRLPIRDITSGFNVYRKSCLGKIDLDGITSEGYAFLVELKYRLYQTGCTFVEGPIIFSERREGQSKMSSKIIWEAIKLPWKLKPGPKF